MTIRTYVVTIGIDDSDYEVKHITYNAPGEDPIVWNAGGGGGGSGHREPWPAGHNLTNPPADHSIDPLFDTAQVLPIEVYVRNPSCVRVGGWLYCP